MSVKANIVVIENIVSPYMTILFSDLRERCPDVCVLYIARIESNRQWTIREEELVFPHDILFKDEPLDHVGSIRQFAAVWSALGRLRPDVCIVGGYSYPAYWAAILWVRIHGTPAVLWSSTTEADHPRRKWKELIKGVLVKGFDAYNTYGSLAKEYLVKLGVDAGRIRLTGLAADNSYFEAATETWRAKRNEIAARFQLAEKNFLYVGRFSSEKNIGALLSAYELAKRCIGREWGLVLVGDGPQRSELEVRSGNLSGVRMVGFQQRDSLPMFLAASDVLILPSTSEPWGLVVNEAMAAGLPVLVSNRCGCCPELVCDGENGYTFEPGDVASLAEHMMACATGGYDLERMGAQSRRIVASITPAEAARGIHETLVQVMSRRLG